MARFKSNHCIDPHLRIDAIEDVVGDIIVQTAAVTIKNEDSVVGTPLSFTILNFLGVLIDAVDAGGTQANITVTGSAGSQNLWESFAAVASGGSVSGGPVSASTPTDTFEFGAGDHIEITISGDRATFTLYDVTSFGVVDPSAGSTLTASGIGNTLFINGANGIIVTGSTPGGLQTLTLSVDYSIFFAGVSAGDGLSLTGSTFAVDLADTTPCLEFDSAGPPKDLALKVDTVGGLAKHADGVRDKWRYHLVRGQSVGVEGAGVDNVVSVHGETPVAGASDELIISAVFPLNCSDNAQVYAKFMNDGSTSTPVLESFSTDVMENFRLIVTGDGFLGYVPSSNCLLGHVANGTTGGQQSLDWKTVEDWLKTITGYSAGANQYLSNQSGTIKWVTAGYCPESPGD